MSLTLDASVEAKLLEDIRRDATAEFVRQLISNGGAIPTLSTSQAAGYLNITTQTLRKLPIPSYDITGSGASISYRLSDLNAYLEERRIK